MTLLLEIRKQWWIVWNFIVSKTFQKRGYSSFRTKCACSKEDLYHQVLLVILCSAHWEVGYMSEPKQMWNTYFRDNLKSGLRNSRHFNTFNQTKGERVILYTTLDLLTISPMCIESQLVCLRGWEKITWYHLFDRGENLNQWLV